MSAHQLAVTIWQLAAGGVISVAGAALLHETISAQFTAHAWWGILYTTVMGTAIAYLLWFGPLRVFPASTAGLGTLLVPMLGTLPSVAFLDERPTLTDIVGFVLIFLIFTAGSSPSVHAVRSLRHTHH